MTAHQSRHTVGTRMRNNEVSMHTVQRMLDHASPEMTALRTIKDHTLRREWERCPHPNACLTCDSFLTTVEFLPQDRDHLTRTEQLIAGAEADSRRRLVE